MDEIIVGESYANAALDIFTINSASLHTDNPGITGENEISSGGYSRQAFSFYPASGSERSGVADANFNLVNGDSVLWVAYWNDSEFVTARKEASATLITDNTVFTLSASTKLRL